jgi:hypothetical protein
MFFLSCFDHSIHSEWPVFFQLGLRTLVIAQRELTIEEFKECDTMLFEARKALENREGKVPLSFSF